MQTTGQVDPGSSCTSATAPPDEGLQQKQSDDAISKRPLEWRGWIDKQDWWNYNRGQILLFTRRDDHHPTYVPTPDLFPSSLPWPWEVVLLQEQHGDSVFYIMWFQDHEKRVMQEHFPPGHVFVSGRGILPMTEARKCSNSSGQSVEILRPCDFEGKRIIVHPKGWKEGFLMSKAGQELERHKDEWASMSADDKAEVLRRVSYVFPAADKQSELGSETVTGNHWLEIPRPDRVRWHPRHPENDLPMGWEAWIYQPTGEVFYYDRVSKKDSKTHPTKSFHVEGLPLGFGLKWVQIDGKWRTYFVDHERKTNTWSAPPGYVLDERIGFEKVPMIGKGAAE
ncbi:hypothetical protein B9Z65_1782 [Elsinoe australis]|uniref:WW domain-containing protein n=1 Tax=Elsinoe australis TaxID=40998 RepID=A0A2P7YKV3_9PEZI|nr:hypothetical protein B9Z65_1782 [Elsinoe australis]